MILVTVLRSQTTTSAEFSVTDVSVRVYDGDDLPSCKVADVAGRDLGQKLAWAVAIVQALKLDLRWETRGLERRYSLTAVAAAEFGNIIQMSGQSIHYVGGVPHLLRASEDWSQVDADWAAEVDRIMAGLGAVQAAYDDGTIGTPESPRVTGLPKNA